MQASTKQNHIWRRWLLMTGLPWFIAVEFFLFAPFKFYPGGLFGYPSYLVKFENWGYPFWFSFVIGAAEIFVAVMMLLPRRRFLGAVILMFIMTAAVATHIINHDVLTDSIAAPFQLIIAGTVALTYWPKDWREPLTLVQRAQESVHGTLQHS